VFPVRSGRKQSPHPKMEVEEDIKVDSSESKDMREIKKPVKRA
jgi:hypothetical protein